MKSFQSSGLLVCVLLVITFVLSACGDTATVTPSPTTPAATTTAAPTTTAVATTLPSTTVATTTAVPTATVPPTTIAIATPTSTPRPATTAAPTTVANTSSSFVVNSKTLDLKDSIIPQEYLDNGRKLRVLFTHMSVGSNIMDGMEALSQQKPAKYSITIVDSIQDSITPDWYKTNTGIGSFTPGMNNQPNTKINAFKGLIDVEGYGEVVDVAMMKLGYDDFEIPPSITWEAYRDTLLYLEKKYPKVKFVWWTLPAHGWGLENREAYNTLVRDYTKANNKILMDIADIESTDPQGNRITSNGVQALFSGYSEDGGHLNSEGSQRMARAMWWLLARLGGWNGQ